MSPEGSGVHLDGLDQLLLSGDNAWLDSSSDGFFDSPSIFPSYATTTTAATPAATTDTCLSQPSITMASEGGVVELDLDQLLSGEDPWLQVATIASSSTSFFDSPSIFPSDHATATTATANTCLSQPGIIMAVQGATVDLDTLEQLLFASPSTFLSDAETATASASANRYQIQRRAVSFLGVRVMDALGYFTRTRRHNNIPNNMTIRLWYPANDDDVSPVGFTGRVYMGNLPEWSPDVQHFTSYEDLGVRGTLGLPVFDKGNYSCLGVIELITTTHKLNFTYELQNNCSALQAVNLTTTEVSRNPRHAKFNGASYMDAMPEILQVLRASCIIHKLPLAQTWATCAQQGKHDSRHSDENYRYCISTIDAACYVNDPRMQNFHEACSELHLLPGQGVVGKAFTTNQPFFLPDIGSLTEPEYPLSHHAKIFSLKGAVAIRLRCTRTGMADFVLEFFLPADCGALGEQKAVLDSLWGTVQSLSQTLRMVTYKEVEKLYRGHSWRLEILSRPNATTVALSLDAIPKFMAHPHWQLT